LSHRVAKNHEGMQVESLQGASRGDIRLATRGKNTINNPPVLRVFMVACSRLYPGLGMNCHFHRLREAHIRGHFDLGLPRPNRDLAATTVFLIGQVATKHRRSAKLNFRTWLESLCPWRRVMDASFYETLVIDCNVL